jgi:hypothetical protein
MREGPAHPVAEGVVRDANGQPVGRREASEILAARAAPVSL